MQTITTIAELRLSVRKQKAPGRVIGLVPTMGNLHAGHLQLVKEAQKKCDWIICSIFVNPLQFGPDEDLDAYPRTLDEDLALLEAYQCDCLFCPDSGEVYPRGLQSQSVVRVPDLGEAYCGRSRPGHFDGVTTVVSKLFNLCQPDLAFFGLKDFQQYLIIRKMVADLHFPVSVVGVETVREPDGLAMSSRNNYLDTEDRRRAPVLFQTLADTRDRIESGSIHFRELEDSARQRLEQAGLRPDYFVICNSRTLRQAEPGDSCLVILAAAFVGKSRLIDNICFTIPAR